MRNVWERNEIDSENNIQSAYRVPKAPEQMWMPRAVQRQQLRTGCNDLCAASMVSYLTRLLALVRGSALERNRKHLAPNVPKNLPSKIMAAAERKGTYAERNGT